jgi:hypothetical protein
MVMVMTIDFAWNMAAGVNPRHPDNNTSVQAYTWTAKPGEKQNSDTLSPSPTPWLQTAEKAADSTVHTARH